MRLEEGKVYTVTCEKILFSGAVFELIDHTTQFIHISQLTNHFITKPEEAVNVGVTYTAQCIYSEKSDKLELTLRVKDSLNRQDLGDIDSVDVMYLCCGDRQHFSPVIKPKKKDRKLIRLQRKEKKKVHK